MCVCVCICEDVSMMFVCVCEVCAHCVGGICVAIHYLYTLHSSSQIQVMYEQYIDKLQSPVHSTRPAREIWNRIDRDTMLYGTLVWK